MEDWVGTVIRDYGTLGIILIGIVIWACNKWIKPLLVGNDKKSSKAAQSTNDNSSNNSNVINVHTGEGEQGVYSKEDLIYDAVRDLKVIVNDNNTRLNDLSHRFNELQDDFNEKVTYLETRVNQMPVENIVKAFGEADRIKAENEQKMFLDSLRLGAAANKLLEEYTTKINCTHIFVASFHNGTSSLTGNPYFKFDIIKEAYHPTDIQENDHPFEPVYRDCQLTLLGKLPEMLVTKGTLYFILDDDNNNTEMQSYDNIIINRMKGMGIKQIALNVAYDNELVSGFVGCVKYDNKEKMNIKMLQECTQKLELIYKRNKTNEIIYGED